MTGISEARAWLDENAPGWRILHVDSTLTPGLTLGSPTSRRVVVTLVETGVPNDLDVTLVGEGDSIIDAVRSAVGGLVE